MTVAFPGGKKFSQITPSPANPTPADFVVGLQGGINDVLFSIPQLIPSGGGGGAMPVRPVVSAVPEASHVIKASAGNVFSAYAINLSYIDGYLLLLDAAALAPDGPVVPLAAVPLPAGATSEISGPSPIIFNTGIVAVLSSGANPFTQVTTGGLTGYISCQAA